MVTLWHSFFLLILLNALKLIKTSESNNSFAIVEGAINIERVFKKRSIALYWYQKYIKKIKSNNFMESERKIWQIKIC